MLRALLHRLVSHPTVYDIVQRLFGQPEHVGRLRPLLAESAGRRVVDLGAGTGAAFPIVPREAVYIWLDNDVEKLRGFRSKHAGGALALLGDASAIGLADRAADYVVCLFMSHHLTDAQLTGMFAEAARICRRRMIFADAVARADSAISRLLWRYDRGRHPRTPEQLRALMSHCFAIEAEQQYTIYHTYWLAAGRVRSVTSRTA